MARPKEFDPKAALTAAMEKFWEGGYEATSLVDLTECMGVQKASLYATYGDKRRLFMTALSQYMDQHYAVLVTEIERAPSVRDFLRDGLLHWMREAATKDSARGCFCVNTAVELGPRDPEIAKMLALHARRVEDTITAAIVRAQTTGEVRTDIDARTAARFIYVHLYGLSAAGKGCFNAANLEPVVEMAMTVLDPRK
jgi:TetR/AcrR family transcriptional repressor of nem operon